LPFRDENKSGTSGGGRYGSLNIQLKRPIADARKEEKKGKLEERRNVRFGETCWADGQQERRHFALRYLHICSLRYSRERVRAPEAMVFDDALPNRSRRNANPNFNNLTSRRSRPAARSIARTARIAQRKAQRLALSCLVKTNRRLPLIDSVQRTKYELLEFSRARIARVIAPADTWHRSRRACKLRAARVLAPSRERRFATRGGNRENAIDPTIIVSNSLASVTTGWQAVESFSANATTPLHPLNVLARYSCTSPGIKWLAD